MSADEYRQALGFMEKSLVEGRGMVGIFCYDIESNSLAKVQSLEDYKDKPRGRVFFNPADKRFIVCVGSWISECPDAIDVIVEEYGLENENYEFTVQEHWEIGMGYGE